MKSFKQLKQDIVYEAIVNFKRSLGIDRENMPQVPEKEYPHFFQEMKKMNIKVTKKRSKVGDLFPTQKAYNDIAVNLLVKQRPSKLHKALLISKDNYLLDGHHRWAALKEIDPNQTIEVYEIGADVMAALEILKNYSRVEFRPSGLDLSYKKFAA